MKGLARLASGAVPALAAVGSFLLFIADGVPAALLASMLAGATAHLAVVYARRPQLLAVVAAACAAIGAVSNLLFGESAPLTTTAILAFLVLIAFAGAASMPTSLIRQRSRARERHAELSPRKP